MASNVIGTVQETFRSETEDSFEWRLQNIFWILEQYGVYFSSPDVSFSDRKWSLKIFRQVSWHGAKYILLSVGRHKIGESALITVGIKKKDGTEKIILNQKLSENKMSCDKKIFWLDSDLLSQKSLLEPWNVLTITCNIRIYGSHPYKVPVKSTVSLGEATCTNQEPIGNKISRETQTESISDTSSKAEQPDDIGTKVICTLREHLKDLLLDGDDHDVTFIIKNREFKAHRCMLRARSPVFSAMFKHDMKESTDDPIAIDDCSAEAFGEFLQYVYTGKFENFSPSIAVGVYYAGDKYNVSGLTEVCVKYLKTSLSTSAICDVITLAAKYGEEELHERAMTFFSEHLEEIMLTNEWKRFLIENFDYANDMCLKAVKNIKGNKTE